MTYFRLVFFGALLALAGCAAAPAQAYNSNYGYDLSGIEIRRIGNDKIFFREFQDRAMHKTLEILGQRGVPRAAVKKITIDTHGGEPSGGFFGGGSLSVNYDLWVTLDGCPKSIYLNASASGNITNLWDKGGCLGQ